MATVTARGEASVRVQPDAATLWLVVTTLEPDASTALADATARAAVLAETLDELGVPAAARTTSSVSVREEVDYTQEGRRSRGHRASAGVSVRIDDPSLAGRLVVAATERAGAHVSGPQWHLDPANPAHLEAARLAAADARRKAQAYAEGIGARLGAVERIEEPGDHSRPIAFAAAKAAGGDELPVDPGLHEVTAAVLVTFALASEAVTSPKGEAGA